MYAPEEREEPAQPGKPKSSSWCISEPLCEIKLKKQYYTVGWKLGSLILGDRVEALWPLLFEPKTKASKDQKSANYRVEHGLAGSLLLKVGSPYSAE
jgi:hypothetical protein